MSKFIIEGGYKLHGTVRVQGSKNAAFPVIAAALLGKSPSVIRNVPEIADMASTLAVLKHLHISYKSSGRVLTIDPRRMRNFSLPHELAGKFRGSIVFAGALLAKYGRVQIALPGGDHIGARPIDVHLEGFRKLGAKVSEGKGKISITSRKLRGTKIAMGVASVTGTENLILASVFASGTTQIKLAATEPHVQDLCRFLNKMGARISGIGTPSLVIRGVRSLHGATHTLRSDEIAAVTFAAAAAATRGHVKLIGLDLDKLEAPLNVFERMGVNFKTTKSTLEILPPKGKYNAVRIITGVYPHLLTDMQPLMGVLATQAEGTTAIHDWIYEGRQGYLRELMSMGAKVKFDDIHRAKIAGPVALRGAEIRTPDIRAGASVLIAALVAKGRSVLYNAEIIDRGYEKIDERLRDLGAKIERIN